MTISQENNNRKSHNWLICNAGDQWLKKFKSSYRGRLYDHGCGEMPYREWLLKHADQYSGVDWGGKLHQLKTDIMVDLNDPLPIESEVADTVIFVMSLLMHGVWAIGQHIAPLLGKYLKPEGETTGYFVVANRAVRST